MKNPSLDLVEFIETQILPQYQQFDRAHNMEHVTRVIRSSLQLAQQTGADIDMVYTIAAYHDLGLTGPRAIHHITSGKILMADARLKRWFHRASASRAPRSIYGKIVAEADRDLEPTNVIRRTIQFGLANYAELDREGHWSRLLQHLDEKYSTRGYIHLWISGSQNERWLAELRQLIANPSELRPIFEKLYDDETKLS